MRIAMMSLLLAISVAMYGQADFSGNWKLNPDKSQFNNMPGAPTSGRLIVEQKVDTITYWRNDRPKETLKIDNENHIELSEGEMKTQVSMKLAPDQRGLIETRTYSYDHNHTQEVAARKVRTWTLSDDKKTLTIRDQIESTTGKTYEMVIIYDKQ